MGKRMKTLSGLCTLTVLAAGPGLAEDDALSTSRRTVMVREAFLDEAGRIRLHVSVQERSEGDTYPLSTLESEDFRIRFSLDPDAAHAPTALATFSNAFPPLKRAAVIVFDNSTSLPDPWPSAVRTQLSELLPSLNSRAVSLQGISGDKVEVLAEISPAQSDNPYLVLKRLVQTAPVAGPQGDFDAAVCAAADTIAAWRDTGLQAGDQAVAMVITHKAAIPIQPTAPLQACYTSLRESRAYLVALQIQGDDARNNGLAISHPSMDSSVQVRTPLNLSMALNTVRSLLDSEYVLSASPPLPVWSLTTLFSDPALAVQVNYHGQELMSQPRTLDRAERRLSLPSLIPVLGFLVGGTIFLTLLFRRTLGRVPCADCGRKVRRDHSDCPFRSPLYHAHLIVLSGVHQGQRFPLHEGSTTIGRGRRNRIRLRDRGMPRFAAIIRIEPQRAFLTPALRRDGKAHVQLNGWPIIEGRYLSHNSVIRIGSTDLLFEPRV